MVVEEIVVPLGRIVTQCTRAHHMPMIPAAEQHDNMDSDMYAFKVHEERCEDMLGELDGVAIER